MILVEKYTNTNGDTVVTLIEDKKVAVIERFSNMVDINVKKWNAKSEYEYDTVSLTKEQILELAEIIKKENIIK